jgi:hypothetical protein
MDRAPWPFPLWVKRRQTRQRLNPTVVRYGQKADKFGNGRFVR